VNNIIVIGGSAGSLEPLITILHGLPIGLDAAVLVSVHTSPDSPGMLAKILSKAGPLPAAYGRDGEEITAGRIYVAPPDHHLSLEGTTIQVVHGPRENMHRPSIDVLFRSAAKAIDLRVAAVLLSGMDDDGAAGLREVKNWGGLVVLQSQADAQFPRMLRQAGQQVQPDFNLPADQIAAALVQYFRGNEGARRRADLPVTDHSDGSAPTEFSCPECGGVLWQNGSDELGTMRCRVGHAYSYDALLNDQTAHIEQALWAGLRALEEKAALLRKLSETFRQRNQSVTAEGFENSASLLDEPAETLRGLILDANLHKRPATLDP